MNRTLENLVVCIFVLLLINLIWMLTEIALYGSVQECCADTLVSYLYTVAIFLAYSRGLRHGKEDANAANR